MTTFQGEAGITRAILRLVTAAGCYGQKRHGSLYGKAGDQDIEVLVPVVYQQYPVPLYVEVKRPGGQMTPLQVRRAAEKRRYGAVVITAYSAVDVLDVIREIRERRYDAPRTEHDNAEETGIS